MTPDQYILAGFILGYLALKSRSFLWGWMLHWGVAITMDVLVIGHELRRSGKRYGLATQCIGAGMGISTIIEAL